MFVVLMAGGTGTRFWPRSRKSYPKQLLNIIGSRSMLQLTFDRIKKLTSPDKILIITNDKQKPKIEDLTKLHDEIVKESEDIRKLVTHDFKEEKNISEPFEQNYLPALDTLLANFKELSEKPEDAELLKKAEDSQNKYTEAHNSIIETMNKNIFY